MTIFKDKKRLVLKIGSSLLVASNGKLRTEWLTSLAQDIAKLRANGTEILLVSSGSVALGRSILQAKTNKLNRKQAAAACGQPLLMQAWQEALAVHQLTTAQILVTLNDTETRSAYLSAHQTIRALLAHGVIPIINENDSVTTHGILYGDNDRLAARIAAMCDADALLLLSDVDGLFTENPNDNPQASFIETVEEITSDIHAMAGRAGTIGSGGMITKIEAAAIATRAGCHTYIANGQLHSPLFQMKRSTEFIAHSEPLTARKRWISGTIQPSGTLWIDDGAIEALNAGKSLLHVGITKIEGEFNEGDTLQIRDKNQNDIGKGLSNFDASIAQMIIGKRSDEIEKTLGYQAPSELIHRDHMVLKSGT